MYKFLKESFSEGYSFRRYDNVNMEQIWGLHFVRVTIVQRYYRRPRHAQVAQKGEIVAERSKF